jgi:hypothetical protein
MAFTIDETRIQDVEAAHAAALKEAHIHDTRPAASGWLTSNHQYAELAHRVVVKESRGAAGTLWSFYRAPPADRAVAADRAVLAFLKENGFDAIDAYHALNSRCARHMGDALMDLLGFTLTPEAKLSQEIAFNLGWKTPAQMYAAFGETRAQLELDSQREAR